MIRAVLLIAALLSTSPVHALSCLPWGVTDAYLAASASADTYLVVHGQLHFEQSELPEAEDLNPAAEPTKTSIAARAKGKALGPKGFEQPFGSAVELRVECLGSWCAWIKSGETYLMFLKQHNDRYLLHISPCGGAAFADISAAQLKQVRHCHQGKSCLPSKR